MPCPAGAEAERWREYGIEFEDCPRNWLQRLLRFGSVKVKQYGEVRGICVFDAQIHHLACELVRSTKASAEARTKLLEWRLDQARSDVSRLQNQLDARKADLADLSIELRKVESGERKPRSASLSSFGPARKAEEAS